MYRTGFVPQQYVVDAICESRFKREQSARRNYQRNVYESIEYNDDRFDNMLHNEMVPHLNNSSNELDYYLFENIFYLVL